VAAVLGPAVAAAQLSAAVAVALEAVAAAPSHLAAVEAAVLEPVPPAHHQWAAHLVDSGRVRRRDSAPLPALADHLL